LNLRFIVVNRSSTLFKLCLYYKDQFATAEY